MSTYWANESFGGCATLTRSTPDATRRKSPRLVLAGGPAFAARLADDLRRQGWHVHRVAAGDDVRKIARSQKAHAVVLPTEVGGESGYLLCAKLVACLPRVKVVVVGAEDSVQ